MGREWPLRGRLVGAVVLSSLTCAASAVAAPLAPPAAPPGAATVTPTSAGGGLLAAPAAPAPPAHAATPQAISDRIASRTRYRDMSDAGAVALGRDAFPELVGREGWQPLALPPGARITGYDDDDRTARVLDSSGKHVLMTSGAPLRAIDADSGLLAPVDLGLERQGDAYVPAASTTGIALAADASAGVTVGDVGMAVDGAASSSPSLVDDTLVWPNAITDGDVIAQVLPGGVELSLTLRSADSPTSVPFRLRLPDGTALRPASLGASDPGSLQVVDGSGRVRTTISSPVAWDAQHVPVPSRWKVSGATATLEVDTAGRDVAYPVAVDPVINDERYNCDLAVRPWSPHPASGYLVGMSYGDFGWGCGMYQSLAAGTYVNFPDGAFSWWELNLGGRPTANIRQVHAENMNHDSGANAIGGPATCTFLNIWYSDTATEYPWSARCDTYRGVTQNVGSWSQDNGFRADKALIGLHTAGAGIRGYFQQSVGVLVAALGDDQSPSATLTQSTSAWQRTTSATFTAGGSDSGLGVKSLSTVVNGATQTAAGSCPGSPVICAAAASASMTFSGLPEGRRQATSYAYDPTGQSGAAVVFYSIDTSSPAVTLSNTLYAARNTSIDAGSYPLTIAATDGSGTGDAARSGVASITTYVDGVQADVVTQACPAGSCPLTRTFAFQPGLYGYGPHTIKVSVQDVVGNPPTVQSFTVTADCCFGTSTSNGALPAGEVRFADVNNDGRDDVLVRNVTTGAVSVRRSLPSGFAADQSWGTWSTTLDFNVRDMNGDGMADLVGRDSSGSVKVARSTGSAFPAATTFTTLATTYSVMRVGDVDGDGNGDLVGENPSTGALQIVQSDGTAPTYRYNPAGAWYTGYTFVLADVDGDGLDDAVGRNVAAGTVMVAYATETGFDAGHGPYNIPANADFAMGDVNADGLSDLLFRPSGSGAVQVRIATQDDASTTFAGGQIWGVWAASRELTTADYTGDGREDLISRSTADNQLWTAISYGQTPPGQSTDGDPLPAPDPEPQAQTLVAAPAQCQNAKTTKLAMMDDGRLLYHQVLSDLPNATQRMAALGTEVVRLTVYWGIFQNADGTYDFSKLQNAVNAITATRVANDPACPPLAVHLTLTGENNRHCDPAFNGAARDCDMTKKPTGVDPDPAQYAAFVRATVKYFSALPAGVGRPSSYSIWNEPNLGKGRFLKVTGTDGKDILSAGKYRQLYRLGYDAAQNGYCDANPGTSACTATPRHPVRVLIGELSEQPLRVREAVGGGTHQYTSLDYLYAALKPASNSAAETTVADGLAVHPYQHRAAASSRGPIEQVGLGKLRGPLKPTGHTYRVGVRAAINDLFARMGTSGTDTTGPRWLKTPNSAAVSLYLTEFGYLNLLPKIVANTKPNRSAWRTEAARATAFTSTKGAFAIAQLAQARWLTLQALTESGSSTDAQGTPNPPVDGNADFKGDFDTGLIGLGWQSNWSDATGVRPYGKGPAQAGKPNGPFYTNFPQPRTAYCAIYKKLKVDGYPEQPTGVPCP